MEKHVRYFTTFKMSTPEIEKNQMMFATVALATVANSTPEIFLRQKELVYKKTTTVTLCMCT